MNPLVSYIATAAILFALSVIVFIVTGLIKNRLGQ
jgi:hypothetical protein